MGDQVVARRLVDEVAGVAGSSLVEGQHQVAELGQVLLRPAGKESQKSSIARTVVRWPYSANPGRLRLYISGSRIQGSEVVPLGMGRQQPLHQRGAAARQREQENGGDGQGFAHHLSSDPFRIGEMVVALPPH